MRGPSRRREGPPGQASRRVGCRVINRSHLPTGISVCASAELAPFCRPTEWARPRLLHFRPGTGDLVLPFPVTQEPALDWASLNH